VSGLHRHAPPSAVSSGLYVALDVRTRLVATFALVAAIVTTPRGARDPLLGLSAVCLAILVASAVPLGYAAKRFLLWLPMVAVVLVLVPFAHRGGAPVRVGPFVVDSIGLSIATTAAAKASLALLACLPLGASTSSPELVHGLARLGLPRTLVLVLGAFVRGASHLGEEATRLRAAREARAFGTRPGLRLSLYGSLLGVLLLRAQARSERVHVAMLARGYQGGATVRAPSPLRARDLGFACALFAALVSVRLLP
jgi:cobalt/nickel transport system permease protein